MNAVCVEQSNVRVQCDTTYRQIFNGQNVIFACRRQANDALLHYPSSIVAADALIKTRIEEIKYLSTKDRQNVERRQLMMVVSLAMIANNDPYSEMVKAALLRAQRKAQIGSKSAFSLTQIADSSRDALLAQIDASITQWIADEAVREFFPKISVPQC